MKQTNNGELCTFLQLLKSCTKIVIPKIQRDYAQGRKDPAGSNLCEEVRNSFVDSIKTALTEDSQLVLDYVYGSRDEANFFYPIDGQQRLTTLFLLHWYVAMKEGKIAEIKPELSKFTYEIRDTSKEFCMSLLDISFDVAAVSSVKTEIANSAKYYTAYNEDPTVQAMLVMLEKIHATFQEEKNLFEKLENIKFWVLSLERFGLTDDLFVKMNARGKRLSRFDTFKSELESALDKRIKENSADRVLIATVDRWKQNIDNEYLDAVWSKFGKDFAERNIYRIIMFFTNCTLSIMGEKSNDAWELNDKQAPYNTVVEALSVKPDILSNICNILGSYDRWYDKDPNMDELLLNSDSTKTITHYVKVRLFGILYWWATIEPAIAATYFNDYYRVLCNFVASNREYAIAARQYQSSIDAKNIGNRLGFVKALVDGFKNETCDFYSYVKTTTSQELGFERQKLNYTNLSDIIALEQCSALRRSIHNFFFDNCIYIKASEIEQITQKKTLSNLVLRIILSFSGGIAGNFQTLVYDDTTNQSGRRKLCYESEDDAAFGFCHKYFLHNENVFGDKIMTVEGKQTAHLRDLENSVKAFAKSFYEKYYSQNKTICEVLQEMLKERLQQATFTNTKNVLWYLVKYSEFFYTPNSTIFYVLRRKHYDGTPDDDNVYDMRCAKESFPWDAHYNPFYFAVKSRLEALSSNIFIASKLFITGNQIEYKHPCLLSNGWQIRILNGGEWKMIFNGNMPNATVTTKYGITSDEFILTNCGEDCIELICRFIMECN